MFSYYIKDEQERGDLDIAHFYCLSDAITAYKALPASHRKALGVQAGGTAADLARCIPIFPSDREGEDVIVLDFLNSSLCQRQYKIVRKRRRNFVVFRQREDAGD